MFDLNTKVSTSSLFSTKVSIHAMSQIHGWPGACLPTHLPYTCLISTLSIDVSCVSPFSSVVTLLMSPSRVQIKMNEMGPSRFIYLRADSRHKENKRKYWYKQKAGKPGKQHRTSECFRMSKLYVSNT